MKKVEHTSEFRFGIYWWTQKTNNHLKNCWSGSIKNKIILIFTIMHFLKKDKENTFRYHYQNLDMIYSPWDIEQNILKLVILGHFCPFTPLKNPPKSKFWKMRKFARDIILDMCTKNHNIWCTVPEIWSGTDRIFCHFGLFFAL